MLNRKFFAIITFVLLAPLAASAHDTLQFSIHNLPCTDHYSYLNNGDSSALVYDTILTQTNFSFVFDSVEHLIDTTRYFMQSEPSTELRMVYDKVGNRISYIHFITEGLRTITFDLKNVLPDISLPPTHFSIHSDTLGIHGFTFFARYHFLTSGGYIENSYTSKGNFTDSTWFDFSLTPEKPTASVDNGSILTALHLYPNPVKDILHIQSADQLSGPLEICDVAGKVLVSKNLTDEKEFDVNVSHLKAGTNFLRIGEHLQKFIIIH
jgi:hypothetical protein